MSERDAGPSTTELLANLSGDAAENAVVAERAIPPVVKDILEAKHSQFRDHEAGWKREERRLYGGDAVLVELAKFRNEDADHYAKRQNEASYLPFPKIHAGLIAGHLRREGPRVGDGRSWGTLGEVREIGTIDKPTIAELLEYNLSGIGSDGSEYESMTDGMQERALATGLRWGFVEMPDLRELRTRRRSRLPLDEVPTEDDVLNGFRPYAVEWSPLQVPFWEIDRGQLQAAIIRIPVSRSQVVNGAWQPADTRQGYYLLVREGYTGFGDYFARGGWWKFNADKELLENGYGSWRRTRGQIPLFPLIGDDSQGTYERPAMSRSLTMELGQIAVGLMNRISERDFDASDAAKSMKYILGTDPKNPEAFNLTVSMHESGAILVPVVAYEAPDGKQMIKPDIYDSSSGAVPAEVFTTIIQSKIGEAREVMIRQLSSSLDASGRSREAAFAEATSPLLARLAAQRQRFENTLIYFAELRAGADEPQGYSLWPRRFDLAPIVSEVDATLDSLRRIGASSPTWVAELLERGGKERRVWPQDEATQESVRTELVESVKRAGRARSSLADLASAL